MTPRRGVPKQLRRSQALALATLLLGTALLGLRTPALAQELCAPWPGDAGVPCDLGTPGQQAVTLRAAFDAPGQSRTFRFQVGREGGTATVYVGDLWHDVDVSLWSQAGGDQTLAGACEPSLGCISRARPSRDRIIQLVRPKGVVETLDPGSYLLVVAAPPIPDSSFLRGFTVQVAVLPRACAVGGDSAGRYSLGLVVQPGQPSRFDLLTFTAFLAPPFGDLFDFEWQLDGQPVTGPTRDILQRPTAQLPGGPFGEHQVRVTARGARPYPDPAQPDIPPTIDLACSFRVG